MVRKFQIDEHLLFILIAALAGVLFISADLATAGAGPRKPSDCVEGLDCPPSEHASDNAKPPSSVPAGVARTRKMGPDSCAAPFRAAVEPGGEGKPATPKCVLDQDLILNETLELSSFTTLDCQNHAIRSSRNGTNLTWPSGRSAPEAAIFLNGAHGVTIENCVIEGFDFGILALVSKVPAGAKNDPGAMEVLGNDIVNNTIAGRYVSVGLVSFDNTRIRENDVSVREGGVGVLVLGDSDGNRIVNNVISMDPNNDTSGVVNFPGPVTNLNPLRSGPGAIYISQGSGFPNLMSVVFGGALYQFPTPDSIFSDERFSEDNTVEGNTISATLSMNDVSVSNAQRTIVRGNDLKSARIAILFGGAGYNVTQQFPGRCTNDSSRLCLTNSNCFIPEFDNSSKGSCANVTSKRVLWISDSAVIEGNRITGPLNIGLHIATPNALIKGNNITGPVFNNTEFAADGGTGIALTRLALESATATRNSVSGFPAPLRLFNISPVFGANISLNDLTNYTAEVLVQGYNLPTELSVGGKGNFWGLSCNDTGGFDAAKVLSVQNAMVLADGTVVITGIPNPFIVDSHPYGVPVSGTPDVSLPPTCQ